MIVSVIKTMPKHFTFVYNQLKIVHVYIYYLRYFSIKKAFQWRSVTACLFLCVSDIVMLESEIKQLHEKSCMF